jgi:hypothetical protein
METISGGWKVKTLAVRRGDKWINMENLSGENTLLYASEKPSAKPDTTFKTTTGVIFPEPIININLANGQKALTRFVEYCRQSLLLFPARSKANH